MDCDDSLRQDSSDEELSFLSEQLSILNSERNLSDEQSIVDVNEDDQSILISENFCD